MEHSTKAINNGQCLERNASLTAQADFIRDYLDGERCELEFTPDFYMGSDAIHDILETARDRKQALNKLLFGSANKDYALLTVAPTLEDFSRDHGLTYIDVGGVCAFNDVALADCDFIAQTYTDARGNTRKINKLDWHGFINSRLSYDDPEIQKARVEAQVKNIKDRYTNAVKGRLLYVTTNPFELILQGANANYRSCNSPNHQYFGETISNALSKSAFAIFDVKKTDYDGSYLAPDKNGRCYGYAALDDRSGALYVLTNKGYGVNNLHTVLKDKIGELLGFELFTMDCANIDVRTGDSPGYFDIHHSSFCAYASLPQSAHALDLGFPGRVPCLICGETHDNNNGYCDSCEECDSCSCEECGRWLSDDELNSTDDGGIYCDDCFNDRYIRCDCCNELVERTGDTTHYHWNDVYCESCFFDRFTSCEECGETISLDGDYSNYDTETRETLCECCYDNRFTSCAECGEAVHRDALCLDETTNDLLCKACYGSRLEGPKEYTQTAITETATTPAI